MIQKHGMLKSKMPAPVPQLLISTQLLTDSRGDTASCCSCWMCRQLYYHLFRSYLDFFDHDLTGCGANKTNCCSAEQKERRSLGFYFNPLKASDVLFISHNIDPISLFHFHGYVRESRCPEICSICLRLLEAVFHPTYFFQITSESKPNAVIVI